MGDIEQIINDFSDKMIEERRPAGIGAAVKSLLEFIRFPNDYRVEKEMEEVLFDFHDESPFCFYPLRFGHYAGYYEMTPGDDGAFLILTVHSGPGTATLTIMLPLIASLEEMKRIPLGSAQFWGAHLAVERSYQLNDLFDHFNSLIRENLNRAKKAYQQYRTQLKPDEHFAFFVSQRLSFVTDVPGEYNEKLARVLLKKIRKNMDQLHMPRNMRTAHVELGDDELRNTDILISKLFDEGLVTTITDIAWHFLNINYVKEAEQFASLAYQLNDWRAEEILDWVDELENDGLYWSEVENYG